MRVLPLVLAWALLQCPPAIAEIAVADDAGRMVTLDAPPRRIVSLAPHVTELLYAAGAGGRLAGAVEFSDYPAAARRLPRVGDGVRIDRERVLALRPDLVVAWGSGTPEREWRALERLGIPVFLSEPRRLEDIPGALRRLGRLAGTEAAAEGAARDFRERLAALRARHARRSPRRVFYQVAAQPLTTVNGDHIISAVLDLCGGRNVFAALPGLAPGVSAEAVLAAAPEVILFGEYPGHDRAALAAQWGRWDALPAVRLGHVYGVPADEMHRPAPRILDAAEAVCEALESTRATP